MFVVCAGGIRSPPSVVGVVRQPSIVSVFIILLVFGRSVVVAGLKNGLRFGL